MANEDFDVIVVGSGASGGWAAKEFCEAGFKTLVLERGKPLEHSVDYDMENVDPWDRHDLPPIDKKAFEPYERFPGWRSEKFYDKFEDAPYQTKKDDPFIWVRPGRVGGKSLVWGRQVYRWSDLDFEANKKDGHGIDWPIRYADIAPWYSHVEKFIGVSGSYENLPQLPDSEFMPAMDMNVAEKHVKKAIESKFDDRTMIIGRTAMITEPKPEQGRTNCQYRSQCNGGCSFGAYYSSVSVTLPAAEATGNLTIKANSVVASLEYDAVNKKVTGVRIIDRDTKVASTIRAKVIFLCASTIGSTQILMNSKSATQTKGLGGNSDSLGHYLMDHTWGTKIQGTVPGYEGRITKGRRANGIYVPRFRNINREGDDGYDFVRGYNFQGGASHEGWAHRAAATPGFGKSFKKGVQTPGEWRFAFYGFAECLPYKDNKITLDEKTPDPYGIPQVRFDAEFKENEFKLVKDMMIEGEKMLIAAGVKNVRSHMGSMRPGFAVHEMGTARMGEDPSNSVLNKWNQVHDAPNVFVTDGACMTSASSVNPTLTFMAITARAANHAIELLKEDAI